MLRTGNLPGGPAGCLSCRPRGYLEGFWQSVKPQDTLAQSRLLLWQGEAPALFCWVVGRRPLVNVEH